MTLWMCSCKLLQRCWRKYIQYCQYRAAKYEAYKQKLKHKSQLSFNIFPIAASILPTSLSNKAGKEPEADVEPFVISSIMKKFKVKLPTVKNQYSSFHEAFKRDADILDIILRIRGMCHAPWMIVTFFNFVLYLFNIHSSINNYIIMWFEICRCETKTDAISAGRQHRNGRSVAKRAERLYGQNEWLRSHSREAKSSHEILGECES